jgi:alpha-L-fucosidase
LPQAAACLEKFADWMSTHSEAIHGTSASPFERLPFDGRCTQKPGTLYLHVFAWPDAGSLLIPMRNEVKEVRLLGGAGEGQLAWELGEDGVRLSVPTEAPHPIASVIALRYEGKLEVLAPPVNLALGLPVKVSSTWPGRPQLVQEHITDGDPHSLWAAEEPARAAWVQLDLGTPADVSSALMSDAPYGRTRSYSLEAQVAGEWRVLGSGETLGAQATLHFEPVRAQVFRLSLTETSDTPTLADFQLFGQPAE